MKTFRHKIPRYALALTTMLALSISVAQQAKASSWTLTDSMTAVRFYQTATLLPNGMVLVVGGYGAASNIQLSSAEQYDPATGTWTATGSLTYSVGPSQTATLLPNGLVLEAGSSPAITSTSLYDSTTGTWTATGAMNTSRDGPAAVLLFNGKVLVLGGYNGSYLADAELYDPAAGTWTKTGAMNVGRQHPLATLLPNGKVLVAGGHQFDSLSDAELYDPATGTWTTTGPMAVGRAYHTMTLLPNGTVLVAGGGNRSNSSLSSAELYNPITGSWRATGSMTAARFAFSATLLPNGMVLAAGGNGSNGPGIASAELYNPATGTWTATAAMPTALAGQAAALLPGYNKVLVAGGSDAHGVGLSIAELYDPGVSLSPQTIYMNFESINAGSGVDATAYLASFGVTLTNVSNLGSVHIKNDTNFYGSGAVFASSSHNFLLQEVGSSPPGVSFTMLFRTPLRSLTFTRCAVGNNVETPIWTATAYSGSTNVGSVGVCCIDSDTGQPAKTYTLTGPGITSLTVTGNGQNSAAMASAPLDDFYMTPETPGAVIITNTLIPNGLGGIAANPALNKIYLSGQGAQPLEVDGTTFAQTPVSIAGDGVDVDLANNNFWEAGLYSGRVTVWNSNNAQITTIPLADCPTGVNVDSAHRRAWVSAQCGGGNDPVWVIDADSYAVIAGPIGSGGVQGATQVNPTTGRFYIDPNGASKRVDPSTFSVTVNAFGTVLGVNANSNLLYAVTGGSTLQIIDGAPDPEVTIASVPLGFDLGSYIGVNSAANRIYVGSSGSNLVAVLNALNGALLETISLGPDIISVGSITVDATRGRVYVLAFSASSGHLYVIQDVAPPSITSEPMNTTASPGGTVTLSVGATGYPLLYQWAFNGTNIAGATGATLTLTQLSAANVGVYTVTVSNGSGAVTSQTISLAIVGLEIFAGVVIDGPIGSEYTVQSTPALGPLNWTTRTNVTLATQPYFYIDYSSPTNSQQFYRAVPLVPYHGVRR